MDTHMELIYQIVLQLPEVSALLDLLLDFRVDEYAEHWPCFRLQMLQLCHNFHPPVN